MTATDRIFFEGHYHNDVFFEGRYHKEAWLNGELVWQKAKGEPVKYVSMISYANGRYYAIAESSYYLSQSRKPVLYEGTSLLRMKRKGPVFGETEVRGNNYAMHAHSDRLVIIRTYSLGLEKEMYVSVIPLTKNGVDMSNAAYGLDALEAYEYSGYKPNSGYSEWVYGKGSYYGCVGSRFQKNGTNISDTAFYDVWITNGGLVVRGAFSKNTSDAQIPALRFGILDDENDSVDVRELNMSPVFTALQDDERSGLLQYLEEIYDDYEFVSEQIDAAYIKSMSSIYRSGTKMHAVVNVILNETVRGIYTLGTYRVSTTDTAKYNAYYQIEVNLNRLVFESVSRTDAYRSGYGEITHIEGQEHVYWVMESANGSKLSYFGTVGNPINLINPIKALNGVGEFGVWSICTIGNKMIIGFKKSQEQLYAGKFIVVDTENNASKWEKIQVEEG